MSDWQSRTVEECLGGMDLRSAKKLKTGEYRPSGKYPVVDQGKGLIAGWTDDESGLIQEGLPLVVFGDHTRALKYVDFPFVRGADGTQILKAKPELDPLFFYYALRALKLPSQGYNHHFKALKERDISFPDRAEQENIARCLWLIDDAMRTQEEALQSWERLKRAAMTKLFSEGLRGEAQVEYDLGSMPSNWLLEPISLNFSVVSGGTPSRRNNAFWEGGTIPWVKTTEVDYCVIDDTEEYITEAGLSGSAAKLLPKGTLLMAMYGQGVTRGKVALLGIDAACNQACAAINPLNKQIDVKYLYHFLTARYENIRRMAHGGQQQNLNLDIVRSILVPFSQEKNEQKEIVAILDAIDEKIELHRAKHSIFAELLSTLLHELMSGKVCVGQLNLSSANDAALREKAA